MKEFRNPQGVHPPLASYSHQVEIKGNQRWLVLSGQVGMDVNGKLPDDPIMQLRTALENIKINLKAAKMDVMDIVKLTFILSEVMEADARREVISSWLGDHQPAMTLMYVAALATPNIKVEIEAMACRSE